MKTSGSLFPGLCRSLAFALCAGLLAAPSPVLAESGGGPGEASSASGASSSAPRIGFDGLQLGAFIDGAWVPFTDGAWVDGDVASEEDQQEDGRFDAHRIRGGESCRVYGFSGLESDSATLEVNEPESFIPTLSARTGSGASWKEGDARLFVTGDFDAMPRKTQVLPPDNATYKKIVAEYLAGRSLAGAKPNIVQILRVDLDGDGTDEMLITAQNVVPTRGDGFDFAPDKPFLDKLQSPTGVPLMRAGQYSVVLLRRVVGGQAKNIALAEFISKKTVPMDDADPFNDSAQVHKVVAVADLNGDGKMEVILAEAFLRGLFYQVYETSGATPRKVLANCFCGD